MDALTRVGSVLAGLALAVGLLWPAALPPGSTRAADPSEDQGPLRATAAEVLAYCDTQGDLQACVLREAERVLHARGSPAAFTLLSATTQARPELAPMDHQLAHDLGRSSIDHYPNTTAALAECPFTMASGCFHGVLEAHFGRNGPPDAPQDVAELCSPAGGWNRQYQCLHGLGHGLTMVAGHDLPRALGWCDLLSVPIHQDSCHGGAFMENAVGDMSVVHGGHGAHGGHGDHHEPPASDWVRLKPDDLAYPCNAVGEHYRRTCWFLQSSSILQQGFSVQRAFGACDQAPQEYVPLCYQSMGRDISGRTQRNGPEVVHECSLGDPDLLVECIHGAAQEMVNNAGDAAPGLAFCPTVPEHVRGRCFFAVGAMVMVQQPDAAARRARCAEAGPYENDCLMGAGLQP